MFKSLGNLIHRIPWWGLIFGGLFIFAALVMFATPIHVLRLSETGKTPAEKSAIKREINLAFGDRALNIAESVVATMKERATDPDRKRELNHALAEMARARGELSKAQAGAGGIAAESARNAAAAALETATDAAESALDSAIEAREAVEEARDDAIEKLRDKGVDTTATLKSFNELLKSSQDSERPRANPWPRFRHCNPARRPRLLRLQPIRSRRPPLHRLRRPRPLRPRLRQATFPHPATSFLRKQGPNQRRRNPANRG